MEENTTPEEILVDDFINLSDFPHTSLELLRESFSMVPEKTDQEIYEQPLEDESGSDFTDPERPGFGKDDEDFEGDF